jgi:hypothetical protein
MSERPIGRSDARCRGCRDRRVGSGTEEGDEEGQGTDGERCDRRRGEVLSVSSLSVYNDNGVVQDRSYNTLIDLLQVRFDTTPLVEVS